VFLKFLAYPKIKLSNRKRYNTYIVTDLPVSNTMRGKGRQKWLTGRPAPLKFSAVLPALKPINTLIKKKL